MARRLRVQYQGAIYHVTSRGNARQLIFLDDADRRRFVDRLQQGAEDYEVRLYQFCLMPNHFHLVLETPHANLSAFMGTLLTAYSIYFNLRHRRVGHVTQGRFKAQIVEGDTYLLRLSRYVHLNPVFTQSELQRELAARVQTLRRYRWSSYRSYAGLDQPTAFLHYEPIMRLVAPSGCAPARAYQEFVETGLATADDELRDLVHGHALAIGSERFRDEFNQRYAEAVSNASSREDAALRCLIAALPASAILEVTTEMLGIDLAELRRRRYDSVARSLAARMLCRYGQLSQRDAGALLGLGTGVAVAYHLKRLDQRLTREPSLAALMGTIERRLQNLRENQGFNLNT